MFCVDDLNITMSVCADMDALDVACVEAHDAGYRTGIQEPW